MERQPVTLIGGVGLGAGLMYLLDPQSGRRRRALTRDKAVHVLHKGGDALRKTSRDVANRGRGLAAETTSRVKSKLRRETLPERVLADRVRAKLGHHVSHPGAIEVKAEDGQVVLHGSVLAAELEPLLAAARSVRGVQEVDCRLEVHERPDGVPELQGDGARPRRRLSPARLLMGAAGGTLALTGFARRDKVGAALGAVGLGLLARGLAGCAVARRSGVEMQTPERETVTRSEIESQLETVGR
jgi:hypothetical protein